ncbi:MAG TPA: hypothetical protein VJ808_09595 [Gemmatimonadales bacterium]|nr:hypothetical protein [Gemmatimonadales bacterium]
MPKIALVLTLALTTALVSACKDHETVVDPGARGSLVQSQAPLNTLGEDLPFVEIATEVPTFGGFWYNKLNQGQIVVALTDLKDFQRVVAMIPKYLGAHQPTAGYVAMRSGGPSQISPAFVPRSGPRCSPGRES